jgi:Flp pilus assembly secretin CpaC
MPRIFKYFTGRYLAACLAAAAALATTQPGLAGSLSVTVDHAKVMRISRPADIVIIGNPAIADAAIRDSRTLIITGRSFGTTNLIVLDAEGNSIADEIITVSAPNDQIVTVYRRASRQSYSCTPECSPVLVVGDNTAAFDSITAQIKARGALSGGAAQ